ncbi:hypothetical protein [Bacteroides thetaiotaomicron]|nr:hypothetical protein [Bacteroides thetaiotaomicron]
MFRHSAEAEELRYTISASTGTRKPAFFGWVQSTLSTANEEKRTP